MFLVVFYGFFRVGELTTKSQASFSNVLQYSNVSFRMNYADVCGVKMTLARFKHNTNNRPHDIIIDREDSLLFCPVKSLLAYRRSGVILTDHFSALLKVALSLPVADSTIPV